MRILHILVILTLVLLFGCKTEQKKDTNSKNIEQTVPEKIAYAHGIKELEKCRRDKVYF